MSRIASKRRYASRNVRPMRPLRTYRQRLQSVMRSRTSRGNIVHSFTRTCTNLNATAMTNMIQSGLTFTSSSGGWNQTSLSMAFRMDDLPNNNEFAALFDSFRLNGVLIRVKMRTNPNATTIPGSATTNTTANFYPRLLYVFDPDDYAVITRDAIKEYSSMRERILQPNRDVKIFIKPRTRVDVQGSTGALPSLTPSRKQWIDMATMDVNHYALKMVFDYGNWNTNGFNQVYDYDIDVKYYFQCKTPR